MSDKKVVVLQSNYIPWKGYFDLLSAADLFVFHDDLQYTRGDWRNRNQIKTSEGLKWLTIPIGNQDHKLINQVTWSVDDWFTKHKASIKNAYRNAPYFSQEILDQLFQPVLSKNLSEFNQRNTRLLAGELGIETPIIDSSELENLQGKKTEKVISILKAVGATEYISGPAGANYLQEELFDEARIKLTYFDYSGYQKYPQLHEGYNHNVSVLDLIFNCGSQAQDYFLTNKVNSYNS